MPASTMQVLLAVAFSLTVCTLLVRTQRWHGRLSLDNDVRGVQKVHSRPVPRIGGLGVMAGLLAAAAWGMAQDSDWGRSAALLLLCSLPVFGAGLAEDLTKRVSVRLRLLASFASGALATWLLDASLTRLDTPGLDELVALAPLSILFTTFAVGGVTNAVNIIDGLNGLASGSVALMLAGLGAIAWMQGDLLVLHLCMIGIAAVLGFMLLNFPFGAIFLGDGGAYLAGFWVAECAVLLLVRNPAVSTWAPLLACFYPVLETAFSMARRKMVTHGATGSPDDGHLHHVLYRWCIRAGGQLGWPDWAHHCITSLTIWSAVLLAELVAVLMRGQSHWLTATCVACTVAYGVAYRQLARDGQPHTETMPEPLALDPVEGR